MTFPEPARTPLPSNVKVVNRPDLTMGFPTFQRGMVVRSRLWGDDDRSITPAHVNMRYARERRVRVVTQVTRVKPIEMAEKVATKFPARRVWAGIGGFLYIPSFPQLRRKETVWPDST